jgi:hypothetical protein
MLPAPAATPNGVMKIDESSATDPKAVATVAAILVGRTRRNATQGGRPSVDNSLF